MNKRDTAALCSLLSELGWTFRIMAKSGAPEVTLMEAVGGQPEGGPLVYASRATVEPDVADVAVAPHSANAIIQPGDGYDYFMALLIFLDRVWTHLDEGGTGLVAYQMKAI